MTGLPAGWTLSASAFNWTPEVVRAERRSSDIAVGVVSDGIVGAIEVEAGQMWRGFPTPSDDEADDLRERLADAGGRVSIVGASIDEFTAGGRRRNDDQRLDFVRPQLRAASRLGADGVRLPIGQAGPDLLHRLQPELHELDLIWFEEAQGRQTPDAEAPAFAAIAELDDPRIRVLIDISMLMPAVPVTYLERLEAGGLPADLLKAVRDAWRDPATHDRVMGALGAGEIPPPLRSLYMDLVVRFGRSDARDLRPVLGLVSGIHLKFWDLEDDDDRVSQPVRDLVPELLAAGFAGTLCSEWGGHAWLDDDPAVMTRGHLELVRPLLAQPAGQPSRL